MKARLLKNFRRPLQDIILAVEAVFDRAFGPKWNPLRQLGSLAFFAYWLVAGTGLYLFVVFDTSVSEAYSSVEYLTNEQWYLGGIARSFHRYGSDAMVLLAVLHMVREFTFDRYRDVRWYTWFLGVPILWLLLFSGISGYWLGWDELAQYIAVASMEWLDWLGIFGQRIASNFLTRGSLGDRFFTLLIFMHIFAPLMLLFIMWFHVIRVSRPKINPPRGLGVGLVLMLLALSLAKPAISHGPADLGVSPTVLNMDWFYMMFYPMFDEYGPGALWGMALALTALTAAMPWLPPMRQPRSAVVDLEKCNGCTRCYEDCPFNAVTMMPRSDGRPFREEAVVDGDLCTACGICVGACPISTPFRSSDELSTGIDLPDLSLTKLRALTDKAMDKLKGEPADGEPKVLVFGCDHGAETRLIEQPGVSGFSMPCIAMLPPSFIDYALSGKGVDGVLLAGCRQCDCYSRLGDHWMRARIDGSRDPSLRKRVPRERFHTAWAARTDRTALEGELNGFRASLKALAPASLAPASLAPASGGDG